MMLFDILKQCCCGNVLLCLSLFFLLWFVCLILFQVVSSYLVLNSHLRYDKHTDSRDSLSNTRDVESSPFFFKLKWLKVWMTSKVAMKKKITELLYESTFEIWLSCLETGK